MAPLFIASRKDHGVRPDSGTHEFLRVLIFVYVGLLFFEGALRKWIFPGFSTPLLVVRDPLVVVMVLIGFFNGMWPPSGYRRFIFSMALILGVMGILQLFSDPQLKWVVVAYGWRTYILHLPVIFIAARALDRRDLDRFGEWCCQLALPMIVLCYVQYYTGGDSIWNASATKEGVQIAFEGDRVRASGTFSFATGTASFFALVAAFAFHRIKAGFSGFGSRFLTYAALLACIAFMPVSGGRLGLYMVGMVMVCGLAMFLSPRQLGYVIVAAIGIYGLSKLPFFNDAIESMGARVESARQVEDEELRFGFWTRIIDGFMVPVGSFGVISMYRGEGLGLGTQAGSALMGVSGDFLLGEGEWGRILSECGWFVGMGYIGFRVWLTLHLFGQSLLAIARQRNWLPLLLWSAGAWTALQGQLGQPTNLGFFVLHSATVLIALKSPMISGTGGLRRRDAGRLKTLRPPAMPFDHEARFPTQPVPGQ